MTKHYLAEITNEFLSDDYWAVCVCGTEVGPYKSFAEAESVGVSDHAASMDE